MKIMAAPTPDEGVRYYKPCLVVRQLITFAYDVSPNHVRGIPDWAKTDWFEVDARAATPAKIDEMRLLVRQLLADRFALRAHTQAMGDRRYTLVLAKADGALGPNAKAAADCVPVPPGAPEPPVVQPNKSERAPCGVSGSIRDGIHTRNYRGMTMKQFAGALPLGGETVVDETGLSGAFDFTVTVPADEPGQGEDQRTANVGADPALLPAIERQLGLKIVSTPGATYVLVIDSMRRPTEN